MFWSLNDNYTHVFKQHTTDAVICLLLVEGAGLGWAPPAPRGVSRGLWSGVSLGCPPRGVTRPRQVSHDRWVVRREDEYCFDNEDTNWQESNVTATLRPVLVQCCASVADACTALSRLWADIWYRMMLAFHTSRYLGLFTPSPFNHNLMWFKYKPRDVD